MLKEISPSPTISLCHSVVDVHLSLTLGSGPPIGYDEARDCGKPLERAREVDPARLNEIGRGQLVQKKRTTIASLKNNIRPLTLRKLEEYIHHSRIHIFSSFSDAQSLETQEYSLGE